MWPLANISEQWTCKCVIKFTYIFYLKSQGVVNILCQRLTKKKKGWDSLGYTKNTYICSIIQTCPGLKLLSVALAWQLQNPCSWRIYYSFCYSHIIISGWSGIRFLQYHWLVLKFLYSQGVFSAHCGIVLAHWGSGLPIM